MKKLACLIFVCIAVGYLAGCQDPPTTSWDTTVDALINDGKAWKVEGGSVTLDGSDVTNSFTAFRITFTNGTYTSSEGGDAWPDGSAVQWTLKGDDQSDASTMIRADQVEVQIEVTKGDQLIMSFNVAEPVARTVGLTGDYNFNLKSE